MHELRRLFEGVARGVFPDADGVVEFVDQPSPRDCGVIAFTAHSVVFADVDREWMRALLPADDVSAPLNPPFLRALEERTGRRVDNLDLLAVAGAMPSPPPAGTARTARRGRHTGVEISGASRRC
ncbi:MULTISPECIES: hypothetical protein [unclassified Streptosporangium]|uniref:hypothetical protein n=1 Tax=unclassified Streptosporangium TaxID=2632669 RepID=UPI002E292CB9|nr:MULTISPECIES: hypothetical protein [unclassified Streptosporangium]